MSDDSLRLSTMVAFCGLLLAFTLGPLNAVVSHVLVRTLPFALGLGCAIWLMAPDLDIEDSAEWNFWEMPTWVAVLLAILLNISIAALVVVAIDGGGRTLEFFILSSICGSLLLTEIVFVDGDDVWPGLILTQMLVFAFIVRFAALFSTPAWIGIDVWIHMSEYVHGIVATNSLEPMQGSKYYTAPMYHVLVAATSILADIPIRYGLFYSVGIAMVLATLMVYFAVLQISSVRWSLFATALFSFSDFFIVWGIHLIPTSLGLFLFIGLLMLLMIEMSSRMPRDSRVSFLVVVLMMAIIFTHQVSTFIMLVFLISALVAQVLMPGDKAWDSGYGLFRIEGYVMFAVGATLVSWTVTPWYGNTFFESAFTLLANAVQGGAVRETTAATQDYGIFSPARILPYIDFAGMILLMFGAVIAGLYIIDQWNHLQPHITLLISGISLTFFALVPPMFGLRTFLPGRWFAFVYLPFVILTAIGLSTIRIQLTSKSFLIVVLLFVIVFPGSMFMTSDAMLDNPIFPDHVPRYAHTQSEVDAMTTSNQIMDEEVTIWTDTQYSNNAEDFTRSPDNRYRSLAVESGTSGQPAIDQDARWKLYRSYQSDGVVVWRDPDHRGNHQLQVRQSTICQPEDHLAYSGEDVLICGR